MKKFTMSIAAVLLILSLAACTPTQVVKTESAEPSVEASTGGASDKVPDPNVEPMAIISVYSTNEDGSGLNQAMDAVDELTAQAVVDKLIEYAVLEEGTEVLSFDKATGTLDLSKVPEGTDKEKKLLLVSIGNTFTENFELNQLNLKVGGKDYTGGSKIEFNRDYKKIS